MNKLLCLVFAVLAIGATAAIAPAQWVYYYPEGGYYYRPFWSPYYNWPVVVYDPVRARQMEIVNNLKKLNSETDKLLSYAGNVDRKSLKEIREAASDIAKYSERLRDALNDGHSADVRAGYVSREVGLAQIRRSAERINSLVDEVNSTDINVTETVNMARLQGTLGTLMEIEREALTIKALIGDVD